MLVGLACASGCLPEEYSDAQLAAYCNSAGDCASRDEFACWDAACVDHQCRKSSVPRGPDTTCWTPSCETDCFCSPPGSPIGGGKCVPPK